jgi:hypothetical protein
MTTTLINYETNVFAPVCVLRVFLPLHADDQVRRALPTMRIDSIDPGFTATDLNDHRGTQTVEDGVHAIVRYALIGPDGPTGGFFDNRGSEPW